MRKQLLGIGDLALMTWAKSNMMNHVAAQRTEGTQTNHGVFSMCRFTVLNVTEVVTIQLRFLS